MMKKIATVVTIPLTTALLLMACSDNAAENQTTKEQDQPAGESEKNDAEDSDETASTENGESQEEPVEDVLAGYSSEEIEYARVWSQLGANQEIDEWNVKHIPAGEPLNPADETSAFYPEDVVQLAGSRLVDGSVTYSSNGDGTINEYHVPLRWDGNNPAGEDVYKDIIENTKTVEINPGDDEEMIKLINLMQ